MEGCAFAVLDNLRVAEATGVRVTEWLATGGAARSPVWNQIKADVTGRPLVVARRADGGEGGHGLGLFALAAEAVGLAGDAAETVERLLPRRTTFEPDAGRHARYEASFEVYHDLVSRAAAHIRPARGVAGGASVKAAVLEGERQLAYRDVADPVPGDGEVLLEVRASAVCGSDVHRYLRGHRTYPMIMGHEAAGIVSAIGPGVDESLRGRHAALIPLVPCHACAQCLRRTLLGMRDLLVHRLTPRRRLRPARGASCEQSPARSGRPAVRGRRTDRAIDGRATHAGPGPLPLRGHGRRLRGRIDRPHARPVAADPRRAAHRGHRTSSPGTARQPWRSARTSPWTPPTMTSPRRSCASPVAARTSSWRQPARRRRSPRRSRSRARAARSCSAATSLSTRACP